MTERSLQKRKQYLEEGNNLKVDVEELESLLCPEDSEVDFRANLGRSEEQKGSRDF